MKSKRPSPARDILEPLVRNGKTSKEIAGLLDNAKSTIQKAIVRYGIQRPAVPVAQRFWSKVDKKGHDECWPWLGIKNKKGYGQFNLNPERRAATASRLAWELHNGRLVPDGLFILHSCDNPPCCNPAHLSPGTHTQNMRDSWLRGRKAPNGERGSGAKITEEKAIMLIHAWPLFKGKRNAFCRIHGISYATGYFLLKGYTWKHIPRPRVLAQGEIEIIAAEGRTA